MPKEVSTFRLPSEYERQAAEARRRRRMAEMLAQQAYQPQDVGVAPIPAAAPFVQGLQAFLEQRNLRKAEEAEEKARQADVESAAELMRQLRPQQRSGAEEAVAQMAQSAQPGQLSADGTYTPSTITPGTAPIGMPYTQAAPTGEERDQLLYGAMATGSPRAAQLAQLLMSQKPETKTMEFGGQLVNVTGGTATPVTMGGEPLIARQESKAPQTVGGMMWDSQQQKFVPIPDYEEQQGRIAAARRPEVVVKPTDPRTIKADQFRNENALRDEYTAQTASFRTINDAYKKIMSTADTGAGDMSLLYQYVKLLDPGSVVRESEFATAAASGSFGEQVKGAAERILKGTRLPNSLRQSFRNEATNIFNQQKASADETAARYRQLAVDYGLDPTRVVPGTDKSYANEAEAEAAFKAGRLKKGDRIVVNGVSGVWE